MLAREILANENALADVPIFPLAQVVLFPGARLPLHVFEPRYRTMLKDTLERHRLITVPLVAEPLATDAEGRPIISTIAGLGYVSEHRSLADGRSNIVIEGIARVELAELPFVAPYRRARAKVIIDHARSYGTIERTALVMAASDLVREMRSEDPRFAFEVPLDADVGSLANACAFTLVIEPRTRQAILEERDAAARARMVTTAIFAQKSERRTSEPEVLH
jgi:Lon protease-like protein